jgi:GxxExxY protein
LFLPGKSIAPLAGMDDGTDSTNLVHAAITGQILGSFFEVHRELGHGFSEVVYRRALAILLREAGLAAADEVPLRVHFRGEVIGTFRADLIVAGVVLVEIKAAASLDNYAEVQLLNYLKAAGGGVGMLLNFGRSPAFRRRVVGEPRNSLPLLALPT